MSLSKKDIIAAVAEHTALSKVNVESVLDSFVELIQESLTEKIELAYPGLGKFSVTERAARTGRNPATGEPVEIPANTVPKFTPSKALKDSVAN